MCVSLTPIEYIFTGAVEAGVAIGFVDYPEVPSTPAKIFERAKDIATKLIPRMGQRSALIVATDQTEWIFVQPPGAYP